MNVFQLKPKSRFEYCGGMALVAATTFEEALDIYCNKGAWGEEFMYGDFTFKDDCEKPIPGLEWHGDAGVISDCMYFE